MYLVNIRMYVDNYVYAYVHMYLCTLIWKIFEDTFVYVQALNAQKKFNSKILTSGHV